jgi:hypothetical protein
MSEMHLFTSASFGRTTGTAEPSREGFVLRRRTDTEWRLGMDISDASVEDSFRSQPPPTASVLSEDIGTDTEPAITTQEQRQRPSFISEQIKFAKSDELREILWAKIWFKFWLFLIFGGLSFIIVWYGI